MTIKEAWELYNQVDNKLKEIRDVIHQIYKRYQSEESGPLGGYYMYSDEIIQIIKLLQEYDKIIEERKNALVEGSVE